MLSEQKADERFGSTFRFSSTLSLSVFMHNSYTIYSINKMDAQIDIDSHKHITAFLSLSLSLSFSLLFRSCNKYQKKICDPFVGVERIRTELFAFQVEAASAYKAVAQTFTESEKCSLSEIHVLHLAVTTVTVERNSPYKELVKRRWAKRKWNDNPIYILYSFVGRVLCCIMA